MDLPNASMPKASMMEPPIEELLATVDSKFTLVTLTSRRAREITTYFSQLGQGLGSIVPPQVASLSHKPVSIALEEISRRRIVAVRREPAPAEDAAEPGPAAAAAAVAGPAVASPGAVAAAAGAKAGGSKASGA